MGNEMSAQTCDGLVQWQSVGVNCAEDRGVVLIAGWARGPKNYAPMWWVSIEGKDLEE